MRVELACACLLVWLLLAAIPVSLGGIGLSWDALNHQLYLGWVADHPRFDRDFLAASYQSYQYPYLYWPVFKLYEAGASGMVAGVVLVTLHVLAAPGLWLIARTCIPGDDWHAAGMRLIAVLLAFSGQLLLSMMDTTANDGLAAVPFVWAVALALHGADSRSDMAGSAGASWATWWSPARCVAVSGLLAGTAVAFKFSNGPLAVLLPMLWASGPGGMTRRIVQVVRGSAWTIAAFVLTYGYWGVLLWREFGNPMYPFYDPVFVGVRALTGWQP